MQTTTGIYHKRTSSTKASIATFSNYGEARRTSLRMPSRVQLKLCYLKTFSAIHTCSQIFYFISCRKENNTLCHYSACF